MSDAMKAVVAAGQYKDKQSGQMKTRWVTVGAAFPSKKGEGLDLRLDVVPIPKTYLNKEVKPVTTIEIMLRPFDRKEGGTQGGGGGGHDDDIPFAPVGDVG